MSVDYPLRRSEKDGYYKLHDNLEETIVQNLKNLLLTSPGERVMKPDFGVGVRELFFEQDTEYARGKIERRTEQQINKYMPFLELSEIKFADPPKNNTISVYIEVDVKPLGKSLVTSFDISRS